MSNIQQIDIKINELETAKRAYIHYLCSYEAQKDVESTTQVMANKTIVQQELRQLYQQKGQLHQHKREAAPKAKAVPYRYTPEEENAILHFNADRRFTITE